MFDKSALIWQLPGSQALPKAAQNGQSDITITVRIGIDLVVLRGRLNSAACGCGLGNGYGNGGILIVALHHLDGARVANICCGHLTALRLVQLPPNLAINGLRIFRIAFRAENCASLQQFQQVQAILSVAFGTKGSKKESQKRRGRCTTEI